LDEQVATMKRVWRGEPPADGTGPVGPPPLQPGGPPLLAGSMGSKGIRRAARWADGIVGFSFGPDAAEVDAQFRKAEEAWKEAGRDEAPRLVTTCWYALGDDGERRLHDYAVRYLSVFGADVAEGLAALPTNHGAEKLREVVAKLDEVGTDELILVPTTADPEEIDRTIAAVSAAC
jgi:alkanesulfonate monooxygenase SsuD/methylene tetrahydromethanopterin reductase-like flavin-dependent oxidoreductase (luciferase family)